jgi:hypothetical protein
MRGFMGWGPYSSKPKVHLPAMIQGSGASRGGRVPLYPRKLPRKPYTYYVCMYIGWGVLGYYI